MSHDLIDRHLQSSCADLRDQTIQIRPYRAPPRFVLNVMIVSLKGRKTKMLRGVHAYGSNHTTGANQLKRESLRQRVPHRFEYRVSAPLPGPRR
jgi:hypothetical protein